MGGYCVLRTPSALASDNDGGPRASAGATGARRIAHSAEVQSAAELLSAIIYG